MWDADNLKKISQFKGHEERVESVQLIIHDRTLYQGLVLSASRDKTVKYWDIKRYVLSMPVSLTFIYTRYTACMCL